MAKKYDDIVGWITRGGKHIPIRKKDVEKARRKTEVAKEALKREQDEGKKIKLRKEAENARKEYERQKQGGRGTADAKQRETIKESLKKRKERDYHETDTSEAVRQLENKEKAPKGQDPMPTSNSLAGHMDKDGKLTPEREKVHRGVIDTHFKGKKSAKEEGRQPVLTLFGGGSASGKDSIFGVDESKKDDHTVVIDPDGIKEQLPHYTEMANSSGRAAAFFHEESSALAKRTASVSYDEGYDTIYNGTGDGSAKSLQRKIDEAREKGYRVEGKYATVDTEEAVRRNRARYEHMVAEGRPARKVPDAEVRKIHRNVTNRLIQFAPKYDYVELWDNNGGVGEHKLIATGGGGKWLRAVKGEEEALKRFLAKGDIKFFISPEGYVVPIEK